MLFLICAGEHKWYSECLKRRNALGMEGHTHAPHPIPAVLHAYRATKPGQASKSARREANVSCHRAGCSGGPRKRRPPRWGRRHCCPCPSAEAEKAVGDAGCRLPDIAGATDHRPVKKRGMVPIPPNHGSHFKLKLLTKFRTQLSRSFGSDGHWRLKDLASGSGGRVVVATSKHGATNCW